MESKYVSEVQATIKDIKKRLVVLGGNSHNVTCRVKDGRYVTGDGHKLIVKLDATVPFGQEAPDGRLAWAYLADNQMIDPTWGGDGWGHALTIEQVRLIKASAMEILDLYEKDLYFLI